MRSNNELTNFLIAIALLMAFIFGVSFFIYYAKEHYSPACGCNVPLPLMILILSSLGVFIGAVCYYLFLKSFLVKEEVIHSNVEKTLDFLEPEERKIIKALIDGSGRCAQNTLKKITGIDAVRLHRRIVSLESRGIIKRERNGMTKIVILEEPFSKIFIK
ncbi:MAG: hypothetical protein QXW00_03175 [Candidatus Woesearchaeota archaeon]